MRHRNQKQKLALRRHHHRRYIADRDAHAACRNRRRVDGFFWVESQDFRFADEESAGWSLLVRRRLRRLLPARRDPDSGMMQYGPLPAITGRAVLLHVATILGQSRGVIKCGRPNTEQAYPVR